MVDLNALVDTGDYTSITGLTEASTTAAVATEVTNALTITGGTETVSITGADISAADANTIANATSGVVTATVTAAAASTLAAALTNTASTDALTLTVNAEGVGATDAGDLIALNADTDQAISLDAGLTSITATYAEATNIYSTNAADYTGEGDEAINLEDANLSAANVDTIANLTSGAVTATITTGAVTTTLNAIGNVATTDTITFTTNDTAGVDA